MKEAFERVMLAEEFSVKAEIYYPATPLSYVGRVLVEAARAELRSILEREAIACQNDTETNHADRIAKMLGLELREPF